MFNDDQPTSTRLQLDIQAIDLAVIQGGHR
jgi:hypothetical protein